MIDHTFSTVAMAKSLLMSIEGSNKDVTISQPSMKLILETLIGLYNNRPDIVARNENATRAVATHLSHINSALDNKKGH